MSPASLLLFFTAYLCLMRLTCAFMQLPWIPEVENHHSTTYQCVFTCCKMSLLSTLKPQAYYSSRLVPHRAVSSVIELLVVSVMQSHYISTLLCVSNSCKMSLSSIIKASNLLLWKTCAPQGSFVFNGPHCGFCDAKSYMSTLLCVSNRCKMSSSINIKAWSLSLWQTCAPQGSFVFKELIIVPVVQNHHMSTLLCVSNRCKSLHQ